MTRKLNLKMVRSVIESHFGRALTSLELEQVLNENREAWRFHGPFSQFLSFLLDHQMVRRVILSSKRYGSKIRFAVGDVSEYSVALSLRPESYLTHASAIFLHGLTDSIPKTVYANREQSPKASRGRLTQEGIHRAFSRPQRKSSYEFRYEGRTIVLLSGKHTGRLEVEAKLTARGDGVEVTGLERTLIDIVVRPEYAGGVHHVLQVFRAAKEKISVNKLVATLRKLDYLYPYHQAIGFYMERAGYEERRLGLVRAIPIEFDFYLAHDLRDKEFDSSWRIFFPKGL